MSIEVNSIYETTADATPVLLGAPVLVNAKNANVAVYTYRQSRVLPKGSRVTVARQDTIKTSSGLQPVMVLDTGEFIMAGNTLALVTKLADRTSAPETIVEEQAPVKVDYTIFVIAAGVVILLMLKPKNV